MKKVDPRHTPLGQFSSPRFWPTWLGLGLLWLLAHLPFRLQIVLGKGIGAGSYLLARERRHICAVNLRLCFPELTDEERRALLWKTFLSNGIGAMEVALSWCRDPEDFRARVTVSGMENLEEAMARGKGVLLLCAHFSTLEFGGTLFSLFQEMDVTYRKHKNPLFQAVMANSRQRHFKGVFERENVRGAMKSLKQGRTLWYAPDQDYGAKHSVFVPFFGVEAATITATSRFARVNDSTLLFFTHYRNSDQSGYHLEFGPIIEGYPVEDEEQNAKRINGIIEQEIRRHPDQYLWMHKRFKTQAKGKSARPY